MTHDNPIPVPPPLPPVLKAVSVPPPGGGASAPGPVRGTAVRKGRNTLTDDVLLKRAKYGARNLMILAVLATLGAIVLGAVAWFAKGIPHAVQSCLVAVAMALIAIGLGYSMLAVSARRGNPNAVGVGIVVLVAQIALSFILSGVAAARSGTELDLNLPGLVIPGLIVFALLRNRKVLLELQARGLWARVFGSIKPGNSLCVFGGALLAIGVIATDALVLYMGWKAGQEQAASYRHAEAFRRMIQSEEKEFSVALRELGDTWDKPRADTALAKLGTLEQRLAALSTEAAGTEGLPSVLSAYSHAVQQWREAMLLLQLPNADVPRAQKKFTLGDQLRAEALRQFDNRYSTRAPKAKASSAPP